LRNSKALTLIVPAITIALVITLFEIIPMRNMLSIPTKPEEEHIAAVLGPGLSPMLMETTEQKAPTIINARNSGNSKIKLVHQGFRIEEEIVKLLAEEANVRQISVGSLVNTILKTHFKRKHLDQFGFVPVSKDFLRKIFGTMPQKEAEEVGKSLGFSLVNEYVSSFFPRLDSFTLIQFLERWLGRFQSFHHRVEDTPSPDIKRYAFSVEHDINLNFSIALKIMLIGLIEPIIKAIVIFGDPTSSTLVFSFDT
jgi:hypothetical protein